MHLEGKPSAPAALPASRLSKKAFVGTILGIDPSLRGTGLAVVEFAPRRSPLLLTAQTIRLARGATMVECLAAISRAVSETIDRFTPDCVAMEQTIFVQNIRTAQVLGASRGAAMAAAGLLNLSVHEYPPLRIKQAVVGVGRASKEQVARTLQTLLGLPSPLEWDQADAAAAALCHAFTSLSLEESNQSSYQ